MEQKTYAVLCTPHAFLLRMHGAGVMHGYTCACIAMHSPVSLSLHQLAYRSDPLYGRCYSHTSRSIKLIPSRLNQLFSYMYM